MLLSYVPSYCDCVNASDPGQVCVVCSRVIYTIQQALVTERAPVVRQQLSLLTDKHLRDATFFFFEFVELHKLCPALLPANVLFRKKFQIISCSELQQLVEFNQWLC